MNLNLITLFYYSLGFISGLIYHRYMLSVTQQEYDHLKKLFFDYMFRVRDEIDEFESENIESSAKELIENHLEEKGNESQ